jgi:hypothetical protein
MEYHGPERRVYRVLVTENTEYHMRGDLCVAVRHTKTGKWESHHFAIGSHLEGGLSRAGGGFRLNPGIPQVGDQLAFDNDILTSPLQRVRRPGLDTVQVYKGVAA